MNGLARLSTQIALAKQAYTELKEVYVTSYSFDATPSESTRQACLNMLLADTDLRMLICQREIVELAERGRHSPLFLIWDAPNRLSMASTVYSQLIRLKKKKKPYAADLEPLYHMHRSKKTHLNLLKGNML